MSRRTLARIFVSAGVALSGLIALGQKTDSVASWPHFTFAAVVTGYLVIVCQVGGHYLKGAGRRDAIREVLEYMHRRSWKLSGGKDPAYRVSFWTPMRTWWKPWEKKLGCCHRTDGRTTKHRWAMSPPHGRDGHGLVGVIWLTEISPSIQALPEGESDEQRAQYWRDTYLTSDEHGPRSWKGAAMTGQSVRTRASSDPAGVLLVECRTPGALIDPNSIQEDPRLFAILWEGGL